MPKYILAAGSSHPNGYSYLQKSCEIISNSSSMKLHGTSRILKNSSKGTNINRLFFNCGMAVYSHLEPLVFYRELKTIELTLGRIRTYKNAPRTIDLDVLIAFDLSYYSSTFILPHKETYTRGFFVSCAMEAIVSAKWVMPHSLFRAWGRLSAEYLAPSTHVVSL
jgi:2-amino-4-hydroxy-6-hydroxymethyldihydropteridine diphosphokinase